MPTTLLLCCDEDHPTEPPSQGTTEEVDATLHHLSLHALRGIQGAPPSVFMACSSFAQCHQLLRLASTDAIAEFYLLHALESAPHEGRPGPHVHGDISALLLRFLEVFSTPHGLPPHRALEHRIDLLPTTGPVKVRPYRYAASQKTEIETIVAELLTEGLIKPSSSSFSAPIILVKKKDGTWHFCVDYRALNAVTVKDAFPMPTVDELLDELHGSVFYSKLDLRSGYHQILLRDVDCAKTAFRTHQGLYEWLVMPFGLKHS